MPLQGVNRRESRRGKEEPGEQEYSEETTSKLTAKEVSSWGQEAARAEAWRSDHPVAATLKTVALAKPKWNWRSSFSSS